MRKMRYFKGFFGIGCGYEKAILRAFWLATEL